MSLKHALKTRTTAGALAMASAKRAHLDSYPTCTVSNQESDRTADGANVCAIIKTRI